MRQSKVTSGATDTDELEYLKALQEEERTIGTPGSFGREKWLQFYIAYLRKWFGLTYSTYRK